MKSIIKMSIMTLALGLPLGCGTDDDSSITALVPSDMVGTWTAPCITVSGSDIAVSLTYTETTITGVQTIYGPSTSCAAAAALWTITTVADYTLGGVHGAGTAYTTTLTALNVTPTANGAAALGTVCSAVGSSATFTADTAADLFNDACKAALVTTGPYQIVSIDGTNLFFPDTTSDPNFDGSTEEKRPVNIASAVPFVKQ